MSDKIEQGPMQHAGQQFSQGMLPSHSQYSSAETTVSSSNSITSSLRLWRKKDANEKKNSGEVPATSAATDNSTHVARVAPQSHYHAYPTNDVCRFGTSFNKDFNTNYKEPTTPTPVKYSEIVEPSPIQKIDQLAEAVQKQKEKDCIEMANNHQIGMKQYQDPYGLKQHYPETSKMQQHYPETSKMQQQFPESINRPYPEHLKQSYAEPPKHPYPDNYKQAYHHDSLKHQYPDSMKETYHEPNIPPQYIPKEPQIHAIHKEPQLYPYIPKEPQLQQYVPKYNILPQYSRPYPMEQNNFLAHLNKIDPRIAQSIINDPHLRESTQVPVYHNLEQTRPYAPVQRMYNHQAPSIPSNHGYPPHMNRNLPQTYGYPQPYNVNMKQNSDPYRLPQYQPGFTKYMSPTEQPIRNCSPRRTFNDNVAMQMNYTTVPSKMPSSMYPPCNQLEYAQHYQHRREQIPEYYAQVGYKPSYMAQSSMPSEMNPENTTTKSNALKQFLENWVDEEMGNIPDMVASAGTEQEKYIMKSVKPRDEGGEPLYVLDSTDIPSESLPQYMHIQQIEKLPENIKGYYQTDNDTHATKRAVIHNGFNGGNKPETIQVIRQSPQPLNNNQRILIEANQRNESQRCPDKSLINTSCNSEKTIGIQNNNSLQEIKENVQSTMTENAQVTNRYVEIQNQTRNEPANGSLHLKEDEVGEKIIHIQIADNGQIPPSAIHNFTKVAETKHSNEHSEENMIQIRIPDGQIPHQNIVLIKPNNSNSYLCSPKINVQATVEETSSFPTNNCIVVKEQTMQGNIQISSEPDKRLQFTNNSASAYNVDDKTTSIRQSSPNVNVLQHIVLSKSPTKANGHAQTRMSPNSEKAVDAFERAECIQKVNDQEPLNNQNVITKRTEASLQVEECIKEEIENMEFRENSMLRESSEKDNLLSNNKDRVSESGVIEKTETENLSAQTSEVTTQRITDSSMNESQIHESVIVSNYSESSIKDLKAIQAVPNITIQEETAPKTDSREMSLLDNIEVKQNKEEVEIKEEEPREEIKSEDFKETKQETEELKIKTESIVDKEEMSSEIGILENDNTNIQEPSASTENTEPKELVQQMEMNSSNNLKQSNVDDTAKVTDHNSIKMANSSVNDLQMVAYEDEKNNVNNPNECEIVLKQRQDVHEQSTVSIIKDIQENETITSSIAKDILTENISVKDTPSTCEIEGKKTSEETETLETEADNIIIPRIDEDDTVEETGKNESETVAPVIENCNLKGMPVEFENDPQESEENNNNLNSETDSSPIITNTELSDGEYKKAYRIEEKNVLLQIGEDLLEINVTEQNGKKIIIVKGLTDAIVNSESLNNCEKDGEEPIITNDNLEVFNISSDSNDISESQDTDSCSLNFCHDNEELEIKEESLSEDNNQNKNENMIVPSSDKENEEEIMVQSEEEISTSAEGTADVNLIDEECEASNVNIKHDLKTEVELSPCTTNNICDNLEEEKLQKTDYECIQTSKNDVSEHEDLRNSKKTSFDAEIKECSITDTNNCPTIKEEKVRRIVVEEKKSATERKEKNCKKTSSEKDMKSLKIVLKKWDFEDKTEEKRDSKGYLQKTKAAQKSFENLLSISISPPQFTGESTENEKNVEKCTVEYSNKKKNEEEIGKRESNSNKEYKKFKEIKKHVENKVTFKVNDIASKISEKPTENKSHSKKRDKSPKRKERRNKENDKYPRKEGSSKYKKTEEKLQRKSSKQENNRSSKISERYHKENKISTRKVKTNSKNVESVTPYENENHLSPDSQKDDSRMSESSIDLPKLETIKESLKSITASSEEVCNFPKKTPVVKIPRHNIRKSLSADLTTFQAGKTEDMIDMELVHNGIVIDFNTNDLDKLHPCSFKEVNNSKPKNSDNNCSNENAQIKVQEHSITSSTSLDLEKSEEEYCEQKSESNLNKRKLSLEEYNQRKRKRLDHAVSKSTTCLKETSSVPTESLSSEEISSKLTDNLLINMNKKVEINSTTENHVVQTSKPVEAETKNNSLPVSSTEPGVEAKSSPTTAEKSPVKKPEVQNKSTCTTESSTSQIINTSNQSNSQLALSAVPGQHLQSRWIHEFRSRNLESVNNRMVKEYGMLMQRFLKQEQLTVEEFKKVKQIIKYKRWLQQKGKDGASGGSNAENKPTESSAATKPDNFRNSMLDINANEHSSLKDCNCNKPSNQVTTKENGTFRQACVDLQGNDPQNEDTTIERKAFQVIDRPQSHRPNPSSQIPELPGESGKGKGDSKEKRRNRKRFRNLYADEDSDCEIVSVDQAKEGASRKGPPKKPNFENNVKIVNSNDYSVHQSDSHRALKLVFKRSVSVNAPNLQPVVRIERSGTLDELAKHCA